MPTTKELYGGATYLGIFNKVWEVLRNAGTTTRNELAHALGLFYTNNAINAELAEALGTLKIEDEVLTRLKLLKNPGARGMLPTEDTQRKAGDKKELPRSERPRDSPVARGQPSHDFAKRGLHDVMGCDKSHRDFAKLRHQQLFTRTRRGQGYRHART